MSGIPRALMIAATATSVLTAGVVTAASANVLGLREPRLSVAKWTITCGPGDETGFNSKCTGALDARASSQGVTMTLGTASTGNGVVYACFRGFPENRSSAMVDTGLVEDPSPFAQTVYDLRPSAQTLADIGCPANTEVTASGGGTVDSAKGPLTLWIMSDRQQ